MAIKRAPGAARTTTIVTDDSGSLAAFSIRFIVRAENGNVQPKQQSNKRDMDNRPPQKKVGKTISNIPRRCSASIFLLTMHIIQASWPAGRTMPTSIHPPLYSTYSSSVVPYAKLSYICHLILILAVQYVTYIYQPFDCQPPSFWYSVFFLHGPCKEVTTAYEK